MKGREFGDGCPEKVRIAIRPGSACGTGPFTPKGVRPIPGRRSPDSRILVPRAFSPFENGSCGSLPGNSGGTVPDSHRLPYSPLSGHTQGHAVDEVVRSVYLSRASPRTGPNGAFGGSGDSAE